MTIAKWIKVTFASKYSKQNYSDINQHSIGEFTKSLIPLQYGDFFNCKRIQ